MGMKNKLTQEAFAKLMVKTSLDESQLNDMGIFCKEASSNEGRILENASKVLTSQDDKAVKKDMSRLIAIVNNKDVLNVSEGNDLIRKYKDNFVFSKKLKIEGESQQVEVYPYLSVKIESRQV